MERFFKLIKNEKTSLILVASGLVLIGLAIIFFLWSDIGLTFNSKINSEKFGQLGDFIGGIVGSMWALAGVLLFYIALTEQRGDIQTNQKALKLQIEALNNQEKEFRLQRKELESSRKVYEQQSKTFRIQQFESNFYSLLNIYMSIKNSLNVLVENKDYFKDVFEKLKIAYDNNENIIEHHIKTNDSYFAIYNNEKGHLSHYFKSIYRILKIIDTAPNFSRKEKVFYSKILRAQITDYEQLILYYNSHSYYGLKAQSLILNYNLLKHISLFDKPEFKFYYNNQGESNIALFLDFLTAFLATHINDSYDISFNKKKIVEKFDPFNCLVGMYFEEQIEVKIFCNKDLSINNIKLEDSQFSEFLNIVLHERIVLNTYLSPEKVTISKYLTETENDKIFGYIISTDSQLNLNRDKF
ncbi:putative phage abortive infection protein [Aquimarina macrocephali]|uniref:putative phage abortive infection protein n=1 Tax=Aquimarina macrocephali TaxID=666563 RepID=UPI000466662E|nr:putative phage abortive infection protein [Aquimarina macrocephali]